MFQKIPRNYCPSLDLPSGRVWELNELKFRNIQKCTVSCTNTQQDVTNLVNHWMVKNTKTWISWEWNITLQNQMTHFEKLSICRRGNLCVSSCYQKYFFIVVCFMFCYIVLMLCNNIILTNIINNFLFYGWRCLSLFILITNTSVICLEDELCLVDVVSIHFL